MKIVSADFKTTHALLQSNTISAGNETDCVVFDNAPIVNNNAMQIPTKKLSPTIAIVHDTRVKIKSTGELVHLPSELNKANASYEAVGVKIKDANDAAELEKLAAQAGELKQRIDLLRSVYPE